MNITQKEIDSVIKLQPFDRYKHFIKRVADFEQLYTLIDEQGLIAVSEADGERLLPFWSAKEYALMNKVGEWGNYEYRNITLDEFENEVIDTIESNNFLLDIFPINNKTGFVVSIEEFIRDLTEEMKKYS